MKGVPVRIAIAAWHPAAACAAYQGDLGWPHLLRERSDVQAPASVAAAAETADWPKHLIEPAVFMFVNSHARLILLQETICALPESP